MLNYENANTQTRKMINKVPEVTLYFWIIKILCTTTGETGADYLIDNFFGLINTTYIMSAILIFVLFLQFNIKKYTPGIYWLAVVLLSIVGTLITDILTDKFQVSLITSSLVFSLALITTFVTWYLSEKTLSVHSINTRKREFFYWLAILFTFALGTALGDLSAEKLQLGYFVSILIFAGLISIITISFQAFKAILPSTHRLQSFNAIFSFWFAYIITRPLGASIGDYLSQSKKIGGLGLGTTSTSIIFLVLILILVTFLSVTKKDQLLNSRTKES